VLNSSGWLHPRDSLLEQRHNLMLYMHLCRSFGSNLIHGAESLVKKPLKFSTIQYLENDSNGVKS
jgi:hypothetical protein